MSPAERQSRSTPANLPRRILNPRDRFRQNGVNGAILEILREQTCGGHDREERCKNTHRAEGDVLQDLEFLLERPLRHEDRVADQEQCEKKHDVERLESSQLGERVRGDRRDSSAGEGAVAGLRMGISPGLRSALGRIEKEALERGRDRSVRSNARPTLRPTFQFRKATS